MASNTRSQLRSQLRLEVLEDRRMLSVIHGLPDDLFDGTPNQLVPAVNGPLLDHGTADAITGLRNVTGPYIGNAPDVGANEVGMGSPWIGPREFTDLLAYGLPDDWVVSPSDEINQYLNLGAKSDYDTENVRLFLTRQAADGFRSFLLVTFEPSSDAERWTRFEEIVSGDSEGTTLIGPVYVRDGLGATITSRESTAQFWGARVDADGVLTIHGGVNNDNLHIVQDDMFTFLRSLYYGWSLREDATDEPHAVEPASWRGVLPSGTPAEPTVTDNVIVGVVGGDVTFTSASINLDVAGDDNLNATATVEYRRSRTAEWVNALNLTRVRYSDGTRSVDRLSGSILNLSPGTLYQLRLKVSDPDGGNATMRTIFTTRSLPAPPTSGKIIEVWPSDDFLNLIGVIQPGDTVLFHAGTFYSGEYLRVLGWAGGMPEAPVLFRPYGDGAVEFDGIQILASHVWLDSFVVGAGGILGDIRPNIFPIGVTVTRMTVDNAHHTIDADGAEWFVSDNHLIGNTTEPGSFSGEGIELDGRGHVASFNDISIVGDGVSYGEGNIDIHNNAIHDNTDDFIEPDYAWDNYRIWENRSWNGGNGGFSFQPMNGGPWYFLRNQMTGITFPFKFRAGVGAKIVVGNSIVSPRRVQDINEVFDPGSIFANNFWMAELPDGGTEMLGYSTSSPDLSRMRLWDYNVYHSTPNSIIRLAGVTYGVTDLRSLGIDVHSHLVNARSIPADANYDQRVDALDFNAWFSHRFTENADLTFGDFNFDGVNDVADFNIWNASRFLESASAAQAGVKQNAARIPRAPAPTIGSILSTTSFFIIQTPFQDIPGASDENALEANFSRYRLRDQVIADDDDLDHGRYGYPAARRHRAARVNSNSMKEVPHPTTSPNSIDTGNRLETYMRAQVASKHW